VVAGEVGVGIRSSNACALGAEITRAIVSTCTRRCKKIDEIRRIAMHGIGMSINQVSMLFRFGNAVSAFAMWC
jgi:hypothetical protein